MKIGFYLKWNKGSLNSGAGNVIGDELHGEVMCKTLRQYKNVRLAELYAPNYLPKEKLDVMVYLNDTLPNEKWANNHVLYFQNAYKEGAYTKLKKFYQHGYNGYAFMSYKLLEMHKKTGRSGIYLPFGVDDNLFTPQLVNKDFEYEVAYIGNDIKGKERTMRYLLPATRFNMGLYGNWDVPNTSENESYIHTLKSISKGKIPQKLVPSLYSSAKINLNVTHQDCVDWDVITLRTYEVLACKGFLITDRVPSAEALLKDCVIFTDGDDDLVEKVEYYLAHESERKKIAENGYEFAKKHTPIKARMADLYHYLEEIL